MAATTTLSVLLSSQPTRRIQIQPLPGAASSQITYSYSGKGISPLTRPKQLEPRIKREGRKPCWLPMAFGNDDISANLTSNMESPSDVVRNFYVSINCKDMKMLGGYFAADCEFEDLAFSVPFQGVKEVESFLKDVVAAMGNNVKFVLHKVQCGGELTAAVMWHLEWNGKTIPFTRGCSFFEFEKSDEQLLIKKAYVVVESPFKPGRTVLELLKIVTSVFDNYPDIAERLLKRPYVIFHYINKMYKIFVEPFLLPLLIYYSQLWKHMVNALRSLVDMIVEILRRFK